MLNINNLVNISGDIINKHVKENMFVLDGTVGNGNDTLLLSSLVGEKGKVYGFDIQDLAIENTKKLLVKNNIYDNVDLICDSHENLKTYILDKLDFAIYNLGYLPRGDKNVITKKTSTVYSITQALELLKKNGILIAVSYVGHEGGKNENEGLEGLLTSLDSKIFSVLKYNYINNSNNPPIMYVVEKLK